MTPVFAAAQELQGFMESRGWGFCMIGGLAVLRWGEPRLTRDVDVTVLAGFGNEDEFIQPLLERYKARLTDAGEFARRSRVLLLEATNGTPLDVALGGLAYEALAVERSSEFEFEPGCRLRTCSAEDLLVQKLFAFRVRDLADAEGVALRMRGRLDWAYVEEQLRPLAEAKDEPGIMAQLAKLRLT
ncbi:MAG: nucleotidyl transferase AbiEii/AbiGii toxin family protein [Bryobacteraceae bacterium]|nr:nucleotidyl transferase AbiEii/AbiGii toxin family protein [Bryobacteraceae bacterium]